MVGVKYRLVTLSGRWQASEFRKLWLGDTVSQLGSQVTRLALPLTAIVFLSATPLQVAALTAVGSIAPAVMGLLCWMPPPSSSRPSASC